MEDLTDERIDRLCHMAVTATETALAQEVKRHRAATRRLEEWAKLLEGNGNMEKSVANHIRKLMKGD